MQFYTSNGTGLAETMQLTQKGHLGIGTTSPTRTLEVVSNYSQNPDWVSYFDNTVDNIGKAEVQEMMHLPNY